MRDHFRALPGVVGEIRHVAAGDGLAQLRDLLVSAGVVGMQMRVDDVADGLVGDFRELGQHLVGHGGQAGVHQQDSLASASTVMLPPAPESM